MREFVVTDERLATFLTALMPHLDERQRRIVAGSMARSLGRGGIAAVAEASAQATLASATHLAKDLRDTLATTRTFMIVASRAWSTSTLLCRPAFA